ncbi:MAG: Smr/MutS family protein, partial [Synergistaceae bacterium]|nr:Smr/MutS family protein [Synergistaceae bacterium]
MLIERNTADILELDKNLLPFRENLRGELGERVLSALTPAEDYETLKSREKLLIEWLDLVDHNGEFKFNARLEAVSPMFAHAKKSGILSGEELLRVRLLLQSARHIREGLADITAKYRSVDDLRHGIRDFSPEIEALNVIEDSGRLADNASGKLSNIREEIENLKRNGRRIAQKLFDDPDIINMLQEKSLSWREGRFLLLVRQEYINRFPGLALERSSSGNSVYMEPRALSHVNNELIIKTHDEQDEERLILLELTRKILSRENAVINAEKIIGTFDLLCACDYLIRAKKWVIPELTQKKAFKLVAARHPMLKDKAVPIDASCGENFTTLVITGSNTGGKTVTLKTAGVMVAIAWLGLPLPARDGTLIGTFDKIFADIGDEQSIEQNLSTFSSHLKKIIYILNNASDSSLVLLDELGAGTDPHEGAALGVAILETLKDKGSIVLATTHHNPIKQYALLTQGVETASMQFDINKLEPTYKLLMGIPGRSSALLIARRYGMPESVIKRAQGELDSRELTAEDIMSELNERRAALDNAEREFQITMQQAEDLKQQYQSRVREIDVQRDKIMKAADRRAEKFIAQAEETSKEIIRSVEESARDLARQGYNVKRRELKTLRSVMEKRDRKRTEREIANSPKPFEPAVGVTAMVAGSGLIGIINEIKNGRAYMTAGALNIDVPLSQLIATDKKAKVASPLTDTSQLAKVESVPPSIMVRGMLVAEAIPLVANYLDRAYRANHSVVTVIHGRGEGILRREVHALCSRLSYVKSFRLGGEGEGGFGVT